ncbi:MAG: D-alanine--D-alanine ligase [Candidatus Omnitrophota bacterium]|nr:MAG: D-alanine--D-alanine ligase [Candidatus Omnitrophota bacterium]
MKNYGKIAVLAGGPSSEREISLKSGRAVYEALKRKKQDVDFVDADNDFCEKLKSIGADVVFIALHGKFGEDGSVQAILEELNLPYTGSEIKSSRLAIDKAASREVFLTSGLKVPRYKIIKRDTEIRDILEEFEKPFVVKPQYEGSSIGLSIVGDSAGVDAALNTAFSYSDRVIVEEYIHGREFTVGVLEERPLPVIEIETRHDVYDFNAKYMDEETKYIVPAILGEDEYRDVQRYALKAHQALGCRDFSRVDMRTGRHGEMYILEVNTIPGMTERSLLPKAALAVGISFGDLCMKLVDLACKRRRAENGEI